MGWEGRGILRGDMMVWKKRFNFENVKLIMLQCKAWQSEGSREFVSWHIGYFLCSGADLQLSWFFVCWQHWCNIGKTDQRYYSTPGEKKRKKDSGSFWCSCFGSWAILQWLLPIRREPEGRLNTWTVSVVRAKPGYDSFQHQFIHISCREKKKCVTFKLTFIGHTQKKKEDSSQNSWSRW